MPLRPGVLTTSKGNRGAEARFIRLIRQPRHCPNRLYLQCRTAVFAVQKEPQTENLYSIHWSFFLGFAAQIPIAHGTREFYISKSEWSNGPHM
jgi:hypothetical protein